LLHYLKARFVMAIKQLVGDTPSRSFVGQFQSFGAKPFDADHSNDLIRQDSPDYSGRLEVFEMSHVSRFRGGQPAITAKCRAFK
jgi:hypothetical protein